MMSADHDNLASIQVVDMQKARVDRLVPKAMRQDRRRSRDLFSIVPHVGRTRTTHVSSEPEY